MRKLGVFVFAVLVATTARAAEHRPNLVWIVGEDLGPELGCYGDAQAITPNMDGLAREGARFTRCFTHTPVCAPSRSGLITGQYPTTIGTHHMRSSTINFEPQLPYPQRIAYMDEMPTMQVWRRLNGEGKLTGPQKLFFAPTKPREEPYDVESDPHEIRNLADSPAHQAVLKELRAALDQWMTETRDLGEIPEQEFIRRGLVKDVLSTYAGRQSGEK